MKKVKGDFVWRSVTKSVGDTLHGITEARRETDSVYCKVLCQPVPRRDCR
jgi:hypothetical protein